MGCFWGPEARFGAMEGVVRTRVGYAGGTTRAPTYHDIGDHTEVVQLEYDPSTVEYTDLLVDFWTEYDPRSLAPKRQYRSVILAHDEQQRTAAEDTPFRHGGKNMREPAVELLNRFHLAEAYHQKYELRSTPVVGDAFVDRYGDALVDSTAAARVNGYLAGHGDEHRRGTLIAALDLPPAVRSEIRRRI